MAGPTVSQQRLHSQLAPIDLLTREELAQELHKSMDNNIRERYRGLEIMRVPLAPVMATAATVQLFTTNDSTPWGPEQGDIWALRRVNVRSSVLVDTGKYVVYRGSTPSDIANSYSGRFVLEAWVGGATPGQNVNVGMYFATNAVLLQPGEQVYAQVFGATVGNQYMLDAEAIRCPAEMKGKLL